MMKKILALALLLGLFALPAGAGAVSMHNVSNGRVEIPVCSGGCQGHVITGTRKDNGTVVRVTGNHNITIRDLNIQQEEDKGNGYPLHFGNYEKSTVNLTIEGNNIVKAQGGLLPLPAILLTGNNSQLVITADSTGTLTANSKESKGYASAIGGHSSNYSGTVIINGGTIYAQGGYMSAGIGGSVECSNGTIIINGGAVSASAEGVYGVSLGAGDSKSGEPTPNAQITIGKTAHVYMPRGCRGTLTINGVKNGDYVKGTYHDAYVAAGFPCALCKKEVNKENAKLILNPKELDYNGQPQKPDAALVLTAELGGETYRYNFIEGTDYVLRCEMEQDGQSVSIDTPTDAGTYELVAYSGSTVIDSAEFVIKKVASKVTAAPAANTLTYTGSAQALVSAGEADGGTLVYSLDGADFSEEIPTGTDAGDYTVYYTVVGDKNHDDTSVQPVSVSIAKAQPELPQALSGVYGEQLSRVDLPEGWTWDATDAVIEGAANSASYAGDKNHVPANGVTLTVAVVQSQTEMSAAAKKSAYTYGETVRIDVTPKATGESAKKRMARFAEPQPGEVSLWNGETQITEGIPAASGKTVTFDLSTVTAGLTPGSYTLTAKYTANDNMAAQTAAVSFTVAYAEDTPESDAAVSGEKNEAEWFRQEPTLTAPEGSEISFDCGPEAAWSDTLTLPDEEGEYTVTYYVKDEATGLIAEKTVTFKVDKSTPQVAEIAIDTSATTAQITAPAMDAHSGVLSYSLTQNTGKEKLTITHHGDGSFTVEGMAQGKAYEMTLSVRDKAGHTLAVSFTLNAAQLPQTGDDSSIMLWLALMTLAGAAMLALRRRESV